MKSIVLTLVFVLFPFLENAGAQIVLDAGKVAQAGDAFSTLKIDTSGVTEGSAGSGRTWDFSGMQLLNDRTDVHYVTASSTPYASDYPQATVAAVMDDFDPIYTYVQNAGNQVIGLGSRSSQFSIVYTNPIVMMQYPFTYGSSYADTYNGTMQLDTTLETRSGGSISVAGDAYGTIILPGVGAREALRVKSVRVNYDTTVIPGMPPLVSTTTLTSYQWFLASSKFPVLSVSYTKSEGFFGTSDFKSIEFAAPGLTDVDPVGKTTPGKFVLEQNFPNPFNPTTTIGFQLPKATAVTLKVYNMVGQEVATVLNEELPAGIYTVPFDARGLASGTYLYRLEAGEVVKTRKLTLLK